MNNTRKYQETDRVRGIRVFLLSLCLILALGSVAYATEAIVPLADDDKKLKNGSFQEGGPWNSTYQQPNQSNVPAWNTTAFEGKIELFKKNTGTYIAGVTLNPTHPKNPDGTPVENAIAAELNADEESTLYQNVKTSPSSIYEWGLDHGARNGKDIMALVIGPKQSVNPSKPSKDGRDQLMQMVDWLNIGTDVVPGNEPLHRVVYSKKFAASGTFDDNAGNNAFSLTPSTIYTEEWHIWIMASSKATTGINPWNSYGSNAEGEAGTETTSGNRSVDLSKYYLYTVPAGQTETLFGFVSVGYVNSPVSADKAKTYGNFLDNINFEIYHPLSGSTTNHGSAVIGGSDGTVGGEGADNGHKVTIGGNLATYVTDGEPLKVQAVITQEDANDGCEFVGLYYTTQDANGNPVTEFLKLAGNVIDYREDLTDDEKTGKWIKSTDELSYTYYLRNVTTATDLHFIFIKSPTITYDPNGGEEYDVGANYDDEDVKNVYSFKPTANSGASSETGELFIAPYVSHAAEGKNDGWKFLGWKLTGDTVDVGSGYTLVNKGELGTMLLPEVHTVACDYHFDGVLLADGSSDTKAQPFKIYNGNVELNKQIETNSNGEDVGVKWQDSDKGRGIQYSNVHRGLTLVAQWRWLQAFIPQVGSGSDYTNSDSGGIVEITSVTSVEPSDERYEVVRANYNDAYNTTGGKSYHAETDETIKVKAIKKENFTFEGWYDAKGNLITTNPEYTYTETKETVNTYYARFSGSVTQTYIRQVKNGNAWEDTTDDKVGTLGRYTYTDAAGMPISSTATAGTGYKFVGWYDSDGNKVADDKLTNNGATISYTTKGDATYYARFEPTYTVKFAAQTKQANGSFKTDNVGGKVSVASVTDVADATASSNATANTNYSFLGWYDASGNQLTTNTTYSTTTTSATNNVTYYARFEIAYNPTVENTVYLSFIAESEGTQIPAAFAGRNAGTGINADGYGLDNKYGNTIATGFKYSLNTMTDVKTIQITVTVPASAYVKVGGTGSFSGNGSAILTDSAGVTYNKGSIQQISGATTLTYYWSASGLSAGTTYGFVIDNLYAPGATATITINGTAGTQVTSTNGVVNTASDSYRANSHYPK